MTGAAAASEISATIAALGALGMLSMLMFRFALRVSDWYDLDTLPAAMAARVRWWDRHHAVLLVLSACVLVAGLTGLALG